MRIRYFDHAATTPVRPEVLNSMLPFLGIEYGNPSSLYTIGRSSRRAIEEARLEVAKAINCERNEIYFTSCGSESDNLIIKGIMLANKYKGKHMITSKIEHPAVLNSCKWLERNGFDITYLNVDSNGKVLIDELKKSIRRDTVLISIMYANNEIGTIQPITEIGRIAKDNNIIFHTDAVQAMGNIKINVKEQNIDALSMSGHKIYAPKGIGSAYISSKINFENLINGGHQERGRRAGTENVASIVGLGKAISLINREINAYNNHIQTLRDFYISEIERRIDDVKLNGDRFDRLPGNANFSFKGVDAEQLLLYLDSYGICASAGSACTSGQSNPSHVLMAIGLKEEYIQSALRASFGMSNTIEDVKFLVDKIKAFVVKYRE
ncbi:MAG: cysteine desulfurase [Clostridia bacterium]|nr:cysteine desulfurase [Clostridia bacterium]